MWLLLAQQVVFHDCSRVFVVKGTLPRDLLHDGLHPSLQGESMHSIAVSPMHGPEYPSY